MSKRTNGRPLVIAGLVLYVLSSVVETFEFSDQIRSILSVVWLFVGLPLVVVGVILVLRERRVRSDA